MTEEGWLKAIDPGPMLQFLKGRMSDRKLRLFACGCCRRIWDLITDKRSRLAVAVSESFADGIAGPTERRKAALSAHELLTQPIDDFYSAPFFAANAAVLTTGLPALRAATATSGAVQNAVSFSISPSKNYPDPLKVREKEEAIQAQYVRCIFGNPFRPVTLNPSWLTPTVLALANGIYQDKAFDRLPIRADALQDSGCDNEDVLNHCRQPGLHTRGCWTLDLVLGRE
jgi:hypothetical protein